MGGACGPELYDSPRGDAQAMAPTSAAGSSGRVPHMTRTACKQLPQTRTFLDAHLATALQAEEWEHGAVHERADAAVAACLQAESFQQDTPLNALQVEMWQVCSQRVRNYGGAKPLPLRNTRARHPMSEPPLEEEVHSAASQLYWRLSDYGLRARDIAGDGACQFRAVADQLYGDQELHGSVRAQAVKQLRSSVARYEGFCLDENLEDYLDRMAEPSTWGDNLSLQAIADILMVEACLVTSFLERSFICIKPASGRPMQQIWLGFYAEYHYTSLEPQSSF